MEKARGLEKSIGEVNTPVSTTVVLNGFLFERLTSIADDTRGNDCVI